MILSDRDIKQAIRQDRIAIDPFDEADVQPSSVDLHVDRYFRVFHNARRPFIDVKQPMDDLTELVEVKEDESFILHPGEFVLGSTLEYVRLATDLVARLEGKSSLGRLGLLIHSSLPGDEEILFYDGSTVMQRRIGDVVRKRLEGHVVSFDPDTFAVDYHQVTGWHEAAPDRIFDVRLASGRRVRLTGAHALFTLDEDGDIAKVRVHELAVGTHVAIPGLIRDPPGRSSPSLGWRRDLLDAFYEGFVDGDGSREPTRMPSWSSSEKLVGDLMLLSSSIGRRASASVGERAGRPLGQTSFPHREHKHPIPVPIGVRLRKLDRLIDGDLRWDRIVEVRDTGAVEPVFDLEVRPGGRPIENFVAGYGGVFVSNTAGYVDPGFEGHLTLELSNVANLPITIYPGMKIGQISFFTLSSEAENPYGSASIGSKYQGQRGPTPSRYHENFER